MSMRTLPNFYRTAIRPIRNLFILSDPQFAGFGEIADQREMAFRRDMKHRDRGMTITEILGYLMIACIVIGGAIYGISAALSSNRSNNAQRDLIALQTNVRNLFANTSDFGAVALTSTLVAAKQMPASMLDGDNAVNAWGGGVVVTGKSANFTVQFTGVPTDACTKLAVTTSTNTGSAGSGIAAVKVNGSNLSPPIAPAAAVAACGVDGSGTTGGNSMEWTYSR